MVNEAFIYDAVRTPRSRGRPDGSLNEVKPVELGAGLLRQLKRRHDLDTRRVGDVIMGCADPLAEQGGAIGKTIAMLADYGDTVSGMQIDRYCGSGLEAINIGAMKVMCGVEDLVVAGGVESLSRVPMASGGSALVSDPSVATQTTYIPQGISADLIAALDGLTREDVDRFAFQSQEKASFARSSGYFKGIVPVCDRHGRTILAEDDFIKSDTTMAKLLGLKSSFQEMGDLGFDAIAVGKYPGIDAIPHVHTAGNSSGIVDGASAVLIGSELVGRDLRLTPRARVIAMANVGCEPTLMLTGPAPATLKALNKAQLKIADIDLFEVNEAFASVVMHFMKETGVPAEKVNVNGGAIALGHPLGATGGMLISTLLDELERRKQRYGLCTLCIGAGMGIATVIERI